MNLNGNVRQSTTELKETWPQLDLLISTEYQHCEWAAPTVLPTILSPSQLHLLQDCGQCAHRTVHDQGSRGV